MYSQTQQYINKKIEELNGIIKKCNKDIEYFELEKKELFIKIKENGDRIDAAYDVFSPKPVKNDFLKELIFQYEKKIEEINIKIEKNKENIDIYNNEIDQLNACLNEISMTQTDFILENNEVKDDEIKCIDISKIENKQIEEKKIEDLRTEKGKIRDIIYKCENCSAFMKLDINRSKVELESIIKNLKEILNEEDVEYTENEREDEGCFGDIEKYEFEEENEKKYIDPFCEEDEDDEDGIEQEYIDKLTAREREILILIAQGMLNKEIANELSITERTVKNHISNLFKKINVYDRTQAAVFAIKNHIYTF